MAGAGCGGGGGGGEEHAASARGRTTATVAALRKNLRVNIHYSPITLAVDRTELKGNSYQRVK